MPLFPDVNDSDRYVESVEAFADQLADLRAPKIVAKRPIFPKRYLSAPALLGYRLASVVAAAGGQPAQARAIRFAPTAAGFAQRRIVWKSIESLGRLGVCLSALSEARAVLIIRHPCGYVASVQRGEANGKFGSRVSASEDYGIIRQLVETKPAKMRGLDVSLMEKMTPEQRLAWRWVLTCEKAFADTQNSNRALTVRYEDLCARPVDVTTQMFEFAGLAMNRQTRAFIKATTSQRRNGYYSLYHDPMAAASSWERDLSPDTIECVLDVLRQSHLSELYGTAESHAKQS